MSDYRTIQQIAANQLDMKLHMVMKDVEWFAVSYLSGSESLDVYEKSIRIEETRNAIRHHMHREDRQATKQS